MVEPGDGTTTGGFVGVGFGGVAPTVVFGGAGRLRVYNTANRPSAQTLETATAMMTVFTVLMTASPRQKV